MATVQEILSGSHVIQVLYWPDQNFVNAEAIFCGLLERQLALVRTRILKFNSTYYKIVISIRCSAIANWKNWTNGICVKQNCQSCWRFPGIATNADWFDAVPFEWFETRSPATTRLPNTRNDQFLPIQWNHVWFEVKKKTQIETQITIIFCTLIAIFL